MRNAFAVLATVALGLTAGALLAEAAVMIPWWRTLPADAFFAWYAANTSRLFQFFGSLEAVSAVLVLLAAAVVRDRWFVMALLLSVAVLAMFPIYFEAANASFESATVPAADLPAVLARYSAWHWIRTVIGTAAFVAAVLGLRVEAAATASP
jgi:hypothetical protein